MNNKKGLSTVVTTLIIILLVLVAVGIIWGVVNNLLNKSSDTIASSTECLDLDVQAKMVTNNSALGNGDNDYSIVLERGSAGTSDPVYAKISLTNEIGEQSILDFDEGMAPLESKILTFDDQIVNGTKVEVTPYYLDESGSETLCPISTYLEFELYPAYY